LTTTHLTTQSDVYAASINRLHRQFLAILPRIEKHARIHFRFLRCLSTRDDAVAEVVAIAWRWFLHITEQGKDVNDFVTTLADFAVRHVRSGRRLCGQERAKDALSPRARRIKGFRVESLPTSTQRSYSTVFNDPRGQQMMDAFEERLQDNTITPPPDAAAFRIDYPTWLGQLGERHRTIAEDMALDFGTKELATRHKVSPGRISQLRRELHRDWMRFHGDQ
jgi:hypothetical protein